MAEIDSLLTENLSKVLIVAEDLSGDDTIGTVASVYPEQHRRDCCRRFKRRQYHRYCGRRFGRNTIGAVAEIADDVSVIAENIDNVNEFFKDLSWCVCG